MCTFQGFYFTSCFMKQFIQLNWNYFKCSQTILYETKSVPSYDFNEVFCKNFDHFIVEIFYPLQILLEITSSSFFFCCQENQVSDIINLLLNNVWLKLFVKNLMPGLFLDSLPIILPTKFHHFSKCLFKSSTNLNVV